ncbi:MAG: hypothetical protein AAF533_03925 [Acidobacteriota bacterium]
MSLGCHDFDRLEASSTRGDADERSAWREHLASCVNCRRHADCARLLRESFPDAPVVSFSLRFDVSLRRELAARRDQRHLSQGRRRLLAGYVVVSAVVAAGILARVDWSGVGWLPLSCALLTAIATAMPLVLLWRCRPSMS